jgi:hypothetical protein
MLEGASWPIFFYGQAYMGNVEPAFSAALCALSHYSPFVVNLGTALLGWMALLMIARWAYDATGRHGSAWVLLITAIGPPTFYGFQVSPRGGYAVTVLLSSLLVWWICHLTLEERQTRKIRFPAFFGWGLLAGLGWWANSLILPALLTAALVILFGLGRSLWNFRRILTGSVGFFAGSAPFWISSFRHQGDSLAIFHNLDPADFSRRGIDLLTQRLPAFFELPTAGSPFWIPGLCLVLLPPLVAVVAAFRARKNPHMIYVAAAALQAVLTLACYCATRFTDTGLVRYLVPLFLPWALLAVTALKAVAHRTHARVAWVLVLLLSAGYLHALRDFGEKSTREAHRHVLARQLQSFCLSHHLSTVYTGFRHHWLNAALDEHPVFITLAGERLLPNARQGELDSSPAILNNEGFIDTFLHYSGGTAQRVSLPDTTGSLHWNFNPPPESPPLTDDSLIASVLNREDTDLRVPLTDLNLDTTCVLGDTLASETWTVVFHKPVALTGLRMMLDPPDGLPPPFSLEVRPDSDLPWQSLSPEIAPTRFFWSGPRPYWGGRFFHFDLHWPVQPVSALKIHFSSQSKPALVHVAELQFLTASSTPTRDPPDVQDPFFKDFFDFLRDRPPTTVYADRWVSARLAELRLPSIRHLEEPLIGWTGANPERPVVEWTPGTLLIVPRDQTPMVERLLAGASISMRETERGPWMIFDFTPAHWRPEFKTIHNLIWTGQGILRGNEAGPPSRAIEPALPTPIHFRNGARLLGLSPASPLRGKAGSVLPLRYFWECPRDLDPHAYAVFAHFHSGPTLFQDDHLWLAPFPSDHIRRQTQPDLFVVDRNIHIPADLPPGTYHLSIGLLDSQTLKRVPCKTDLPTRHSAVELPLELVVESP